MPFQLKSSLVEFSVPCSWLREHSLPGTSISDFWSPGCERVNGYCSKPPSVWDLATANPDVEGGLGGGGAALEPGVTCSGFLRGRQGVHSGMSMRLGLCRASGRLGFSTQAFKH